MRRKLEIKQKHHTSPNSIRKELRRDIRWFDKHPLENRRSRPPSARETCEWGQDVIEVLVLRREDGGYATVPIKAART